ncbi:MAG: hypothetical protein Q9159_000523 [Coniocarpon cinnabarinum]
MTENPLNNVALLQDDTRKNKRAPSLIFHLSKIQHRLDEVSANANVDRAKLDDGMKRLEMMQTACEQSRSKDRSKATEVSFAQLSNKYEASQRLLTASVSKLEQLEKQLEHLVRAQHRYKIDEIPEQSYGRIRDLAHRLSKLEDTFRPVQLQDHDGLKQDASTVKLDMDREGNQIEGILPQQADPLKKRAHTQHDSFQQVELSLPKEVSAGTSKIQASLLEKVPRRLPLPCGSLVKQGSADATEYTIANIHAEGDAASPTLSDRPVQNMCEAPSAPTRPQRKSVGSNVVARQDIVSSSAHSHDMPISSLNRTSRCAFKLPGESKRALLPSLFARHMDKRSSAPNAQKAVGKINAPVAENPAVLEDGQQTDEWRPDAIITQGFLQHRMFSRSSTPSEPPTPGIAKEPSKKRHVSCRKTTKPARIRGGSTMPPGADMQCKLQHAEEVQLRKPGTEYSSTSSKTISPPMKTLARSSPSPMNRATRVDSGIQVTAPAEPRMCKYDFRNESQVGIGGSTIMRTKRCFSPPRRPVTAIDGHQQRRQVDARLSRIDTDFIGTADTKKAVHIKSHCSSVVPDSALRISDSTLPTQAEHQVATQPPRLPSRNNARPSASSGQRSSRRTRNTAGSPISEAILHQDPEPRRPRSSRASLKLTKSSSTEERTVDARATNPKVRETNLGLANERKRGATGLDFDDMPASCVSRKKKA